MILLLFGAIQSKTYIHILVVVMYPNLALSTSGNLFYHLEDSLDFILTVHHLLAHLTHITTGYSSYHVATLLLKVLQEHFSTALSN